MTAIWTTKKPLTERWAAAHARAIARGTRVYQDAETGQFYATGSDDRTVYRVG